MKRLLRVLIWIVCVGILLTAAILVYSTAKGYTKWYFRVNGVVQVDGRTNGYLHANSERTLLLVTRTDGVRPETYLVPLRDSEMIVDCGAWHPIRFLPTPVGDINPPCSGYDTPTRFMDAPASWSRRTSPRSVEFSTASGKKIKAEW